MATALRSDFESASLTGGVVIEIAPSAQVRPAHRLGRIERMPRVRVGAARRSLGTPRQEMGLWWFGQCLPDCPCCAGASWPKPYVGSAGRSWECFLELWQPDADLSPCRRDGEAWGISRIEARSRGLSIVRPKRRGRIEVAVAGCTQILPDGTVCGGWVKRNGTPICWNCQQRIKRENGNV